MDILIVDDDPLVLASCRKILEYEGFTARTVSSAGEAMDALRRRAFDLVLVDMKMPKHDGLRLMAVIRRRMPNLPIVAISGYATPETVAASLTMGAVCFVPKPFTPDELLRAVRGSLKPSGQGEEK